MRITLLLLCSLALAVIGCDGDDISDNPPTTQQPTTDAGPPDGAISDFDAAVDLADAGGPSAEAMAFCTRFDDLCGYGARQTYYNTEQECLAAYDSYVADRQMCVEGALDTVEGGGNFRDCISASGGRDCP